MKITLEIDWERLRQRIERKYRRIENRIYDALYANKVRRFDAKQKEIAAFLETATPQEIMEKWKSMQDPRNSYNNAFTKRFAFNYKPTPKTESAILNWRMMWRREQPLVLSVGPDAAMVLTLRLLARLEDEFCRCGAGVDRNKPRTWEYCGIHEQIDQLLAAVKS